MRDGETAADDDLAATVEALKAGKHTILWDSEFTGFGVRKSSGAKTYWKSYHNLSIIKLYSRILRSIWLASDPA